MKNMTLARILTQALDLALPMLYRQSHGVSGNALEGPILTGVYTI